MSVQQFCDKGLFSVDSYYGLWMWFPELFKRVENSGAACGEYNKSSGNSSGNDSQIYADGFYTSLSNLPGNILTIILMDKVGRKLLLGKGCRIHCTLHLMQLGPVGILILDRYFV